MKKIHHLFLLLSGILFFASCNSSGTDDLLIVDFDRKPDKEVVLKFEDLVDEVKIVRLETKNDLILPEYIDIEITADYIITRGMSGFGIDQFDNKGNFIRRLANRGRGPNEYLDVLQIVDEIKNRLYLISYNGDDRILRVDLATGQFLDIIRPDIPIWGRVIGANGEIIGFADPNYYGYQGFKRDTLSRIYFVNSETGATRNVAVCENNNPISAPNIISNMKDMFYYIFENSDTLYKFNEERVVPNKIFKISDKAKDEMNNGNTLSIYMSFGDNFIICKRYRKIPEGGGIARTVSDEYLLLNNNGNLSSFDVSIIDKYNIKLSQKEYIESYSGGKTRLYPGSIPQTSGNYLYYSFNAPNAILFLKRALEDETTTDKQRKEINALLSQIDEDDNHIILYGKRK